MKYDGSSPERIETRDGEMESLELRRRPGERGPVIPSAALLSHADDSNYVKINYDNKNNMQSVKISLVLDFTNNFEHKGIANNCLISDISLILCVPNMIRYNCYSDRNLNITERKKDRVIGMEMTDTKNFGAFPQTWKIQSQSISKTVDNNCDFEIFVNEYILINQIVGEAPSDSIPVTKYAINVQGIKYGHPHSHSFNPNLMYSGHTGQAATSPPTHKSDYAFIHTTRIISNHSVFPEADTLSTQNLAVALQEEESNTRALSTDNKADTFKNGDYTFAALLAMVEQAPRRLAELRMRGGSPALRLAGGGESSLNTPSGWGSPPGPNNNGSANWGNSGGAAGGAGGPAPQWGATQRPPTAQPDGNSNKLGGNGIPGSNGSGPNGSGGVGWGGAAPPTSSAQPPSQGGGSGGGSPGGGPGAPAAPVPAPTAKAQLEQLNTMRESLFSLDGWGGQHVNQDTNWDVPTSPEPGVKQEPGGPGPPSWKPTINNENSNLLAGTDLWEANLRNGGQPPPQPVAKTPWGHTPTSNIGGTWGEDDDTPEASNVWNGPPPQQQWGAPPQQPPHWNAPAKKDDWGGWGEPPRPDLHRPDMHRAPAPDPRDMRLMGDMRGDPRGISGRLNGNADMWSQQHMPHMPPKGLMPGIVGGGQWSAQGPKDMGMAKGGSGWEEPSPPAARRSMANFDDGTSLWGQQRGAGMGPWKDMGMGRGAMPCPPGMPPGGRMPAVAPGPMKPDAMWGHPHRNGSWEDGSSHAGNWDKENSWNEGPMNQGGAWPGPKGKPMGGPGGSWDSEMGEWCGPKPGGGGPSAKLLPKDMVWNSKQFRLLVDMGYKKDDVELALRNRDMNVDEAMDLLSQMRGGGGMDTWRRHEDHPGGPPFDHQQYPAPPRPHHSYPPQAPPGGPFPQPSQGLSSINNLSPAIVQKILSQPTSQPPPPFNQQNNQSGGGSQPSTAQLRMLVQQIQMAVTAGYLNHQILNQPLAPQTLVLLNQLLQQIKVLQQFANQQNVMQNTLVNKGSTSAMLQISVQMTKTKQQISNLQQQISAQQAIYVKQQAGSSSGSSGGDFFNKQHDPLAQLQNNFADIALNKDPPGSYGGGSGQQSRLNQWKLPSLDKEGDGPEFSRAPGTTSKPTSSPQLNPLNLQPDNTWSTGRSVTGVDGWPSETSDLSEGKEAWPSSQQHSAASTYTDLVPEFEPGKPWKMKSIEDDPAITPGSVVRSPLSLAAIKEPESLGGGKASPTTPSERSLSSSTWSYPPPAASTPSNSKELWGSKLRSPPGLASSKGPASSAPWAAAPPRSSAYPHQPSWPSTWLLLKNLTAQIDGSTLKTLCMQHGPLQSFHLYLTQGIALAKYSSREEANKAQTALNNCVLGNTTIFAESPAESDVNMILQHLGQGGGGSSQWRGSKDSWGFSSPWEEQRATPSSLASFLPPDLLGGESM